MYFDERATEALGGEVKYNVPVLTAQGDTPAEKLADIEEHYKENADQLSFAEVLVRAWSDAQKQGAMQGSKGRVRGADSDSIEEAITAHQDKARSFLFGVASERAAGGMTRARSEDIGRAIVEFRKSEGRSATDEELDTILAKHGLSLS